MDKPEGISQPGIGSAFTEEFFNLLGTLRNIYVTGTISVLPRTRQPHELIPNNH
jgi:hypothetical protein